MSDEAERIKAFLDLVAPGFMVEGVLPAASLEGIEVLNDAHAVASLRADDRVVPIRFTLDEGKIARVEVL